MGRLSSPALPALSRILSELGENIRLARLRRRLTLTQVADRAGMSRPTLGAIEKGEPGVTLGSVANVLHCLGLEKDLVLIARDDALGRKLQDAELPIPRRKKAETSRDSSS